MSIFGKIASAIFGVHTAHAAETTATDTPMPSNMPPASAPVPQQIPAAPIVVAAAASAANPAAAPIVIAPVNMAGVDVGKILDGLKAKQSEALDWRKSIVDLMKLLKLDSSLTSRKELAHELKYSGDTGDSATMNVWLHKQVLTQLAANGGIVPADLRH